MIAMAPAPLSDPRRLFLSGAGCTHAGGRVHNEDTFIVDDDTYVVADGMGGAKAGEVAARIAGETVRKASANDGLWGLIRSARAANEAVRSFARDHLECDGMATTLTAIALGDSPQRVAYIHVGDSRVYRLRENVLKQVSQDHTVVNELVACGALAPEKAHDHPLGHILTRAVGSADDVEVDGGWLTVREGDRYLLCTDGLIKELSDGTLHDVLSTVPRAEDASVMLVQLALESGAKDNVTAVVVDASRVSRP